MASLLAAHAHAARDPASIYTSTSRASTVGGSEPGAGVVGSEYLGPDTRRERGRRRSPRGRAGAQLRRLLAAGDRLQRRLRARARHRALAPRVPCASCGPGAGCSSRAVPRDPRDQQRAEAARRGASSCSRPSTTATPSTRRARSSSTTTAGTSSTAAAQPASGTPPARLLEPLYGTSAPGSSWSSSPSWTERSAPPPGREHQPLEGFLLDPAATRSARASPSRNLAPPVESSWSATIRATNASARRRSASRRRRRRPGLGPDRGRDDRESAPRLWVILPFMPAPIAAAPP